MKAKWIKAVKWVAVLLLAYGILKGMIILYFLLRIIYFIYQVQQQVGGGAGKTISVFVQLIEFGTNPDQLFLQKLEFGFFFCVGQLKNRCGINGVEDRKLIE